MFDKTELEHLVASHGVEKLCLGTDYPFDMGEPDPVGFLSDLPDDVRRRLAGSNAAGLLGLVGERTA